jgi:hypothetical protein
MEVFAPKKAKKVVSAESVKKRIYRAKKKKDQQQKKSASTRKAAYRATMSVNQKESYNNKILQAMRHKRANLSNAEKEVLKIRRSASRIKRRKLTCYSENHTSNRRTDCQPDDDTIDECKMEALKILHRTILADKEGWHKYPVCVICDCFIIGTEEVKFLNRNQLVVHEDRLSVNKYEEFYHQQPLPKDLRKYYHLPGFPKMLLSPRATKKNEGYTCCETCHSAMAPRFKDKAVPKFSCANGFLIGEFPMLQYYDAQGILQNFNVETDLTDVMRALLSPTRAHGYIIAYTGGKQKSLMGHFQCYEVDHTKLGGSMAYLRHKAKHQHVYCVLSGRMTTNQKVLARERCKVDTLLYEVISKWFIEESGHMGFKNIPLPKDCPEPVIIQDNDSVNNTDPSIDSKTEETFVGGSYFFSSAQDPDPNNSVYATDTDFTMAMLNQTAPTLLVYGGKYTNMKELALENLLPFAFPYGLGTPKQKRPQRVSFEACIQRYMRLAMLQFMRGDVILVMNHLYGRQLSYKSGIMTSRSNKGAEGSENLAELFSQITIEELQAAADEKNPQQTPIVKKLMKSISTSCKAMGHTPEAAAYARRCCFAMQDRFGLNSIFLTVTPDDEKNFRIKLLTNPGKEVSVSNRFIPFQYTNYLFLNIISRSAK